MITKNTELNLFKDEVLKKLRDLETKLTSKITSKELVLNSDYQSFTSKLNLLINNNKELSLTIAAQKVNPPSKAAAVEVAFIPSAIVGLLLA